MRCLRKHTPHTSNCTWSCLVTAMQRLQGSLRLSFVDFSRCSMPPPDLYVYIFSAETSIFSVWARHTDVAGPSLAAVSGTHLLQAGCARLSMPAVHGLAPRYLSRSHPTRRRFQPPPSPVVVFLAATDPTHTAIHCRRSRVSGAWKPPMEQSATCRHISSNAYCFSEPPQDLPFFQIIFIITIVCI